MHITNRVMTGWLGTFLVMGLVAGCNVDATSNTGLRVNVYIDADSTVGDASSLVDSLRFYIAVQHPDNRQVWVLNDAASGILVDVDGRDLTEDPYQLLISEDGDGAMETVKVIVVGERNGQTRLVGQLERPDHQQFINGQIVQRTIWLSAPRPGLNLTWTTTGCLMSDEPIDPERQQLQLGTLHDKDCDGYTSDEQGGDDCNDLDPHVNPGMVELYDCDQIDNDCDGDIDEGGQADYDNDGITACDGDCDDNDNTVYPGAEDICDGKNNDCDGKCDENDDLDGDGFTVCGSFINHETGECHDVPLADCDDNDPEKHPGAVEICNGVDDNCNDICDEGLDPDGDGFNDCGSKNPMTDPVAGDANCVEINIENEDCNPDDPTVHPGAYELCDGKLNDCLGSFSQAPASCYTQGSGQTPCFVGTMNCMESEGVQLWSGCTEATEEAPAAYCGIWPNCANTIDPDWCMDDNMHWYYMNCDLHMLDAWETCGGYNDRPIYYLPFGFSGMTGCQWHIKFDTDTSGWTEIGLVSPNTPMQTAQNVVNSCEAALVAVPGNGSMNPMYATISFSYDNGGGDFYALEMPVVISPVADCNTNETLICTIY